MSFSSILQKALIESTCQAGVGDQWNVVIDRCTTDLIAIGQLALAVVFRNVDNQFEHVLAEHIHDVQVALFVRQQTAVAEMPFSFKNLAVPAVP